MSTRSGLCDELSTPTVQVAGFGWCALGLQKIEFVSSICMLCCWFGNVVIRLSLGEGLMVRKSWMYRCAGLSKRGQLLD